MNLRTALLVILLALIAVFVFLNWTAIVTPTTLSLGFGTVDAPIGMVMLAIIAVLTVFFLLYMAYEQTTVLLEARRTSRALEESRKLADEAEASRFTELRRFLEAELGRVGSRSDEAQKALGGRIDRLESDLRAAIEQGSTTLSAYIGELEDRIERKAAGRPPGSTV